MFNPHVIGPLSDEDTFNALQTPTQGGGGSISDQVVRTLAAASAGYPYFIQEFGSAASSNASSSHISANDAEVAVLAQASLPKD